MPGNGSLARWMYRDGRPNRLARVLNRASATVHAWGVWPTRLVTLEVRGRRSGQGISFPLVAADLNGERYLVAMLGAQTNWVRNVRAAGGHATLCHGRRERVRLVEIEPADRAPIIKRYLTCAPGARAHIPVDRHLPVKEFESIAPSFPVFRIESNAPAPAQAGLWRRWTMTVMLGELVGFTGPAIVGAVTASGGWAAGWVYLLMLFAGFFEGFCLGYAQAWSLRFDLPELPRPTFAVATAVAAVVAYAVGMLPSVLGDRLTATPTAAVIAGAATGGAILLASIGTAQWLVLRRMGIRARWWIATTAAAWLAGLAVFMLVATPLWQTGQPLWLTIGIGVLAGAMMAATVAALTGLAAVHLVRR